MSKKEDIEPKNEHGQLHGLCIYYWDNGNVMYKLRYVNGVQYGLRERYKSDGKLWYKDYWLNGKFVYSELYNDVNVIEFNI